jgi:DNA-binding GntR family transcriptional regulator
VEQLSVSRTAVREAFARLEAEGLIEHGPKVGYAACSLSAEDRLEIMEVRLALESAAIDRICTRGGDIEGLDRLRSICDMHAHFIDGGYMLGAIEADRRFHMSLIELAGNRRLTRLYQQAPLPMEIGSNWRISQGKVDVSEHRQLVETIAAGDADVGRALLRKHLIPARTAENGSKPVTLRSKSGRTMKRPQARSLADADPQ